jgi:hypothetical protein
VLDERRRGDGALQRGGPQARRHLPRNAVVLLSANRA